MIATSIPIVPTAEPPRKAGAVPALPAFPNLRASYDAEFAEWNLLADHHALDFTVTVATVNDLGQPERAAAMARLFLHAAEQHDNALRTAEVLRYRCDTIGQVARQLGMMPHGRDLSYQLLQVVTALTAERDALFATVAKVENDAEVPA